MLHSSSIVELYTNVLFNDMSQYGITDESVRIGIQCMTEVYKADNAKQNADRSTVADFNDVAHRCAYLHKYASLHTALVRDKLFEAVNRNKNFFHQLIFSEDTFKICSLGGGPGSDIIGVLAALHAVYSYFPVSVSVVDYMVDWCYSFQSIIKELSSGMYGTFGNNTSNFLQWRYVGANLLKSLTPEVEMALSTASLVTMIKFVSAASCKDTEFMVKNIFQAMKPGAVIFFIDNDGGGFREIIIRAAHKYNFLSIFGPYAHENYTNEFVKIKRFGAISCFKTVVSIHILQKPVMNGPLVNVPGMHCSQYVGNTERRVLIESPLRNTSQDYLLNNSSFGGRYTPLDQENYSRYVSFNNNNVYSPYRNTPLTPCVFQLNPSTPDQRAECLHPGNERFLVSPETPRAPYRRQGGCLPLARIKNFRRNLSKFKSRINIAFKNKRKNKKIKRAESKSSR